MEENLPLVHYVLRRFRDRGAEYEDLYQYGCIGLVKAVDRFDPSFHVRFSTYAVPIILGEVRRYLRDDGPVHVSRTIHDNAAAVERFREAFARDHAREPTVGEIAEGSPGRTRCWRSTPTGACARSVSRRGPTRSCG